MISSENMHFIHVILCFSLIMQLFFVKMLAFISKEGLLLKTNYVSAGQRFAIVIRFPVLKWGSRQNLIEIIITAVRSPVQGYWVQ